MKTCVNWIIRPRVTLKKKKKHKPNNIIKTSISQSTRPTVSDVTRASLAGVECKGACNHKVIARRRCAFFPNYFDHLLLLGRIAVQICGLLLPMFSVLDITVSCAETDGPIEILFRMWTQVNPRNYVFGGDRTSPEKGQFFFGGGRTAMLPFVKIIHHLLSSLFSHIHCTVHRAERSVWHWNCLTRPE